MTVNPTLAPSYHAPALYQPPRAPAVPAFDSTTGDGGRSVGRPGFDTGSEAFGGFRDPRFRVQPKPRTVVTSGELLGAMITQMAGDRADHKGRHIDVFV